MPDDLVREISILPPLSGLYDGLDPSLPDAIYPLTASPDLVNLRVSEGKWSTRRGQTLYKALPGSGDTRMLAAHYEASGRRIRLAARGDGTAAILYDLIQGTDTAFNATSGGTGLGGTVHHRFQGVTLNDRFYFTDRFGVLRVYQESATPQVRAVALPVKPVAAAVAQARTYDVLEPWNGNAGAAPYGWTVTNAAKFDIQDGSGTQTSPVGGPTILLNTLTNPNNSPIFENVSGEVLASNTIAAMVRNTDLPTQVVFQFGFGAADNFTASMDLPIIESWLPWFVNIGLLGSINFKRFMVTENAGAADVFISMLLLPGRLAGAYRWIYTHYDPTTGRESEPSDVSNGGAPLDLSIVGITGQAGTQAAFQKSAVLSFTSDSPGDTSTTQIRIYRNGGVPSLTTDANGRSVWYRVGTVPDLGTTVSGAHAANSNTLNVASSAGFGIGDWIMVAKSSVGTNGEEVLYVTNFGVGTLTVQRGPNDTRGLLNAHTNGQTVEVVFVDNVPNEQVDTSATIDLERDDPPTASLFVSRSPDGRLWLFGPGTTVSVSNRATPERPTDYEVFPRDVDPQTRRSLLQGWDFQIGGDVNDEAIIWGGHFHGEMMALTRRRLYRIHAYSQADWGPSAVEPALEIGCIAGDTVAEIEGWLYWVADGPRIVRWNGVHAPQEISHHRAEECLRAADPTSWGLWFAVGHKVPEGAYYRLYFRAQGALAEPAGVRSMLAFWLGGAASTESPIPLEDMLYWHASDRADA
jgi:hypothetical protein